jgi:hypothetical protein
MSNDQDKKQHLNHWRAIAEELGLPSDTEGKSSPDVDDNFGVAPVEQPEDEPEPVWQRPRRPEPPAVTEGAGEEEIEQIVAPEESVEISELGAVTAESAEQVDDSQRRGRRRGRRGKRSGPREERGRDQERRPQVRSHRSTESTDEPPRSQRREQVGERHSDEQSGSGKGRRRRRSRSRGKDRRQPSSAPAVIEPIRTDAEKEPGDEAAWEPPVESSRGESFGEEVDAGEQPAELAEPVRWADRNEDSVEFIEESDIEVEEIEETEDDKHETVDDDYDIMDEEDPYADWNVPSWQELIASLYRPER